ncbi:Putative alkyl hydroperoxide reductase (fragment) [Candidatus Zixiibacteriota bacterium]
MTEAGYAERVLFIIDQRGIIRYVEVVGLANLPDNEKAFSQLNILAGV